MRFAHAHEADDAQELIATSDAALTGAARAEGHPVIVLPDSQGRRPA